MKLISYKKIFEDHLQKISVEEKVRKCKWRLFSNFGRIRLILILIYLRQGKNHKLKTWLKTGISFLILDTVKLVLNEPTKCLVLLYMLSSRALELPTGNFHWKFPFGMTFFQVQWYLRTKIMSTIRLDS